jgi:nucleotide-binding universal stress UspA family protein
MVERIMLPLDGSELAERAIHYVRDLAAQLEAEVYLLHACPPEHKQYLRMHQMYLDDLAEEIKRRIKLDWQPAGDPAVSTDVILDEPVNAIFEYIKQKSISIVALTDHASSGMRAWAMGSVADKVVRGAGIPVLLIHITEEYTASIQKGSIRKIMLPLDGSDSSAMAIPYAVKLAKKLKAGIELFSMAQTIYAQTIYMENVGGSVIGFGSNFDVIDAENKKFVDKYLQGVAGEIQKEGINVTQNSLVARDAGVEILELEKKTQPDLVIMATRGRSNIARWALGSVAERVLHDGNTPILMVKEPDK